MQIFSALFVIFATVSAQKRFLFIGNSYTYTTVNCVGDGTSFVETIMQKLGQPVYCNQAATGGFTLKQHANPGSEAIQMIQQDNWDAIVFQDQSDIFTSPTPRSDNPTSEGTTLLKSVIQTLIGNPNPQLYMFATWPKGLGDASLYFQSNYYDYNGLLLQLQSIEKGYMAAGQTNGASVISIGRAFANYAMQSRKCNFDSTGVCRLYEQLLWDDESHPSGTGAILSNLVMLGTVFGLDLNDINIQSVIQSSINDKWGAQSPILVQQLFNAAIQTITQNLAPIRTSVIDRTKLTSAVSSIASPILSKGFNLQSLEFKLTTAVVKATKQPVINNSSSLGSYSIMIDVKMPRNALPDKSVMSYYGAAYLNVGAYANKIMFLAPRQTSIINSMGHFRWVPLIYHTYLFVVNNGVLSVYIDGVKETFYNSGSQAPLLSLKTNGTFTFGGLKMYNLAKPPVPAAYIKNVYYFDYGLSADEALAASSRDWIYNGKPLN